MTSTDVASRAPRRGAPPLPTGDLTLEAPPAIPVASGPRWQQLLMVVPMLAGTVATALMFGGREGASTYTYVVGGIFGLSTLGMLLTTWTNSSGPRRAELMAARRDYLRYLAGMRRRVRGVIADQRVALTYRHPDPADLSAIAAGSRVWERRSGDADFAVVRVGVGPQSLATPLVAPAIDPTADLEPVTAGALRRFLTTYPIVPDLPISIALRSFTRVVLDSPPLARALVCQLATFHSPEELLVVGCVAADRRRAWDWLKWLPHNQHPTLTDAAGPRRLVATSLAELDELLGEALALSRRTRFQAPPGRVIATPHIVVVVDGGSTADSVQLGAELLGITLLVVDSSEDVAAGNTLTLRVSAEGALTSGGAPVGISDALTIPEAETLARRLAPLRPAATVRAAAPLAADRDLGDLLGIDAHADLATLWAPRPARQFLRIPIGTGPDGSPVELDLKEAAQDGMGPHGLIVGATGSGKSELLRTLVLGLAATHSSEALNFVLVDFKGGATFASLDRLPHTSAVITNLADALPLVDRMRDALGGELQRRQELLRAANVASLRDYQQARPARPALPALPSLLIVCDEFTELLNAQNDFIELFLQIGRIGRSIGVHLLLATQRLEEGRLRGLDSNLSYRIALRTFTAHESRAIIGVTDAADLPTNPGHGYLRVGAESLQRFKAAYASAPVRAHDRVAASGPVAASIVDFTSAHLPLATPIAAAPATVSAGPTLLDVLVDRLSAAGAPAAHRVWLPPLQVAPTLDELLGPIGRDPARGVTVADPRRRGTLRVPIALIDRPFEQRRDIAILDLSGAGGHVAIVGAPRSGKSTALRTLVTGLALTHTPSEVQAYCLDFGGGSLSTLRDLPHVGAVAGRQDTAGVRRTVGEVSTLLADRERRFTELGLDSVGAFRRHRGFGGTSSSADSPGDLAATVRVPAHPEAADPDPYGDVFLLVDGWTTLRGEFEDLEPVLVDIATRGLGYGIHLVVTATRWSDLRATVKDLFGSKLELRLGDPADSMVARRPAAHVPAGLPGRGLVEGGLHAFTAQPRLSGTDAVALVAAVAAAWTGPVAPPVRMLPAALPYDALLDTATATPAQSLDADPTRPIGAGAGLAQPVGAGAGLALPVGSGLTLPIGIAESDLRPVLLDFGAEPHLVAFGDSGSGKSTLLRALAETITRRFTPERARIVAIDYRRSLLGAITTPHLIGYGTAADNAAALTASIADYMQRRRPGPDVTAEQLRDRSWWSGPECFVLVDDYDLVATGGTNPVLALLEFLPQARDLGLHLIVTRRAGGAARAQFEPVLQRLRELGSPGILLSGDRDEGPLIGTTRPGPQPPGRGLLVTRRDGSRLIQLPLPPPPPAS